MILPDVAHGLYSSASGYQIYRRVWEPIGPLRGGAVFLHGLGDHSGRHDRQLRLFAERGIRCVAFDLPGHGHTPGPRGHVQSLPLLTDLITENLRFLRENSPSNVPIGLLGHSMGGFLALHHLVMHPEAAAFSWISSPLIDPARKASSSKRALAQVIDRVCPKFTLHSGVRRGECKRDPERIAETRRDPLVHRRMSVRLGLLLLQASRELHEHTRTMHPSLRLLLTHGGADRICPAPLSEALFQRLPLREKEYALFPGLLHEPFNDLGKEAVIERLSAWISCLPLELDPSSAISS